MADRTYTQGFLCRSWGETDLPEAAFEPTMEDVERFIVSAQFGERKLIAELTDLHEENVQMLQEQMKDLHDVLDDMQGLWQVNFEIGGISVEPVMFSAPATEDWKALSEHLTKALGDLSFECFAVFDTCRPSRDTYNRTFDVLEQARKVIAGVSAVDSETFPHNPPMTGKSR